MFATGGALRRLQMCADCRVVDMMENKDEASIFNVKIMSAPGRPKRESLARSDKAAQ